MSSRFRFDLKPLVLAGMTAVPLLLVVFGSIHVHSQSGAVDGAGCTTGCGVQQTSADEASQARAGVPTEENNDVAPLAQVLTTAYENALQHDSQSAGLETEDLGLESASIELSSRLLDEIRNPICTASAADSNPSEGTCGDTSQFRDLSNTLSYAAFKLQTLGQSIPTGETFTAQHALVRARIESMEHL